MVETVEVWQRTARALQLMLDVHDRDHHPVVLTLRLALAVPARAAGVRWDTDHIARSLRLGDGRAAFLDDLQAQLEKDQRFYDDAAQRPTPDESYERLVATLQDVAQKHYGRKPDETAAERTQFRRRRGQLLREMAEVNYHDKERLVDEVHRLSRRLRSMARQRQAKWRHEQKVALREASRAQDFALVHRICRRLVGRRMLARRRFAGALPTTRATRSEWAEALGRSGPQGGFSADPIDWKQERLRVVEEAEPLRSLTAAHEQGGKDIMYAAVRLLFSSRRRRASPPWSVPAEVFSYGAEAQLLYAWRAQKVRGWLRGDHRAAVRLLRSVAVRRHSCSEG